MNYKLPVQLQILNQFIWEKPQVVVKILKKNGIKLSNKPILPEIIQKSVQALVDDNNQFVTDITNAINTNDEASFDPITLSIMAVVSISTAVIGAEQAKKQRQADLNAKQMELALNEKLTLAQIQAMKEQGRIKIMSDTILFYAQSLQSESTQRQKDSALFVGIMAVGLAIVYATTKIFN